METVPLYQVKDWNLHYENARSRKIKSLAWVPVPNTHDGEKYGLLMSHPKAAEIFAAWNLILQIASRCPIRGLLARRDGTPLPLSSLSVKSRAPQIWFEIAMPILTQLGWLEVVGGVVGERPTVVADQPTLVGLKGREQKGREHNTPIVPFLDFEPEEINGIDPSIQTLSDQLVQRLNQVFKRRTTTLWSKGERRVLQEVIKAKPTQEEIDLLLFYYASDDPYRRKDIQTLLNNWNGEVDRARNWQGKGRTQRDREISIGLQKIIDEGNLELNNTIGTS